VRYHRSRRTIGYAATLTLGTLLAACTVDGSPQRGPLDLDTGTFTTVRGTIPGDSEIAQAAVRLGESLILRTDVDAVLTWSTTANYPITGPDNLNGLHYLGYLVEPAEPQQKAKASELPSSEHLRYGYVASGHNGIDSGTASKSLQYAVIRYDGDQAARTAAAELAGVFRTNLTEYRRITGTVAGLSGGESVTAEGQSAPIAAAFVPRGRDVLVVSAVSGDARWAADTVRTTVDRQTASLPPADGLDDPLSGDEADLLARTLPITTTQDRRQLEDTVGGPQVRAHRYHDPARVLARYRAAGVDMIAERDTEVYRAADAERARSLQQGFVQGYTATGSTAAVAPRGLPTAVCTAAAGGAPDQAFTCSVVVDRYLAAADGRTLSQAQ